MRRPSSHTPRLDWFPKTTPWSCRLRSHSGLETSFVAVCRHGSKACGLENLHMGTGGYACLRAHSEWFSPPEEADINKHVLLHPCLTLWSPSPGAVIQGTGLTPRVPISPLCLGHMVHISGSSLVGQRQDHLPGVGSLPPALRGLVGSKMEEKSFKGERESSWGRRPALILKGWELVSPCFQDITMYS